MSFIVAAVLIVVAVAGAAVLAVAAPVLVGVMMFDIAKTEESEPTEATTSPLAIAVKRGIARGFVLGGGVFWSLATFAGLYSYRQTGLASALMAALYPLAGCVVTLVVGWYFERIVAGLLVLASLGVFAWGVIYEFEPGVWLLMTLALIGPMMTAAVLFWLARRDQEAFETAFSLQPQLALVFSARSTLVPVRAAA